MTLSNSSGVAFEQQISEQLPAAIRSGQIPPGSELPLARELASQILVSPATVTRSYKRLQGEGLIVRLPDNRLVVTRDVEEVLRRRALAHRRKVLSAAVEDIKQLLPTGQRDLEIEANHLRRAVEIEQAREMQRSLLPQSPPSVPGLDIAVAMSTASEVGGDYFDFFPRSNGGLQAIIGDATGHGLTAGIMAAMTKACLRSIAEEAPDEMMANANEVLKTIRLKRVLMALSILEIEGGDITVCSAGMPPIFVFRQRSREVEEVAIACLPLGSALPQRFPLRQLHLGHRDALVVMSDGLPELRNPRGEPLGPKPVRSCIARKASGSASDLVAALTNLGSAWCHDRAPDDDVTVLVIKREPERSK